MYLLVALVVQQVDVDQHILSVVGQHVLVGQRQYRFAFLANLMDMLTMKKENKAKSAEHRQTVAFLSEFVQGRAAYFCR